MRPVSTKKPRIHTGTQSASSASLSSSGAVRIAASQPITPTDTCAASAKPTDETIPRERSLPMLKPNHRNDAVNAMTSAPAVMASSASPQGVWASRSPTNEAAKRSTGATTRVGRRCAERIKDHPLGRNATTLTMAAAIKRPTAMYPIVRIGCELPPEATTSSISTVGRSPTSA